MMVDAGRGPPLLRLDLVHLFLEQPEVLPVHLPRTAPGAPWSSSPPSPSGGPPPTSGRPSASCGWGGARGHLHGTPRATGRPPARLQGITSTPPPSLELPFPGGEAATSKTKSRERGAMAALTPAPGGPGASASAWGRPHLAGLPVGRPPPARPGPPPEAGPGPGSAGAAAEAGPEAAEAGPEAAEAGRRLLADVLAGRTAARAVVRWLRHGAGNAGNAGADDAWWRAEGACDAARLEEVRRRRCASGGGRSSRLSDPGAPEPGPARVAAPGSSPRPSARASSAEETSARRGRARTGD